MFSSLPFVPFSWEAKQHVRLMEKNVFLKLQNYQIIDTFAYEKDLRNNLDQSLILQRRKKAKKSEFFGHDYAHAVRAPGFKNPSPVFSQPHYTSFKVTQLFRFLRVLHQFIFRHQVICDFHVGIK